MKSAARTSTEAEAATAKFLKTGLDLGKWMAGFALETAVFTVAGKIFTKQLEEMRRAVERASEFDEAKRQLKSLAGGTAEAGRRIKEFNGIAKNTRFNIVELTKAEVALDALSKGALGGGRQLRQLANIAQDTGKPVEGLAGSIGELYGSLENGRPIANTAQELVGFGAITPAVANQIDRLQQSGAGMAATWGVVEQALAAAEKRAASTKGTLQDLEARRQNVTDSRDAAIGGQFMDGRKAAERAATTLTSATAGAAVDAARPVAAAYNSLQQAREAVVDYIASWKGLGPAITTVSNIFQSILLVTLLSSAKGLVSMIGIAGRAAVSLLGAAKGAGAFGGALRIVAGGLRLVTGPAGLVLTALTFVGLKFLESKQRAEDFEKSLQGQRDASRDSAGALMAQAAAIQTLRDKAQAQIATLDKLREAEAKYAAAQAATKKTSEGSRDRSEADQTEYRAKLEVQQIRDIYEKIAQIKANSLAPDQAALDAALERYRVERQIAQAREDATADRLTGKDRIEFIRGQKAEAKQRVKGGEAEQKRLASDEAAFEPIQRELDLAKARNDPTALAAASKKRDEFLGSPDRSEVFRMSRDIQAREAAAAEINGTRSQIAQNPLRSSALKRQLVQQEEAAAARFGSLDQVSPGAIAQARQNRERAMIEKGLDPQSGVLDNRNVERAEALKDREKQAIREEAERNRQIREQTAQNVADRGTITGPKRGLERDVNAANLRKRQIGELIQTESTRFGVPGFDDRETQNKIDGLRNERDQIDKDLGLKREDGQRGLRGAQVEVKAQRLENGGNDELAARRRDAVRMEERILELREKGLTEEEATKQARLEMKQERRNRRQQRMDSGGESTAGMFDPTNPGAKIQAENNQKAIDAMKSIQVDSMTGIGGNAGGGEGTTNLLRQIRDLLQKANTGYTRDLPPSKWDDNRVRNPPPVA